MRCPECRGRGIVVNCELIEFIGEVGLPAYYAATTLAHRAGDAAGRLPASAWKEVGLSDWQADAFLDVVLDAWPVWECNLCSTSSHLHITEQAFGKAQGVAIGAVARKLRGGDGS
jgi:hypothetical protein